VITYRVIVGSIDTPGEVRSVVGRGSYPGVFDRAVPDGYWIIVKPLPIGERVSHYHCVVEEFSFETDVTHFITVAPQRSGEATAVESTTWGGSRRSTDRSIRLPAEKSDGRLSHSRAAATALGGPKQRVVQIPAHLGEPLSGDACYKRLRG
jgi:hypothetical protein